MAGAAAAMFASAHAAMAQPAPLPPPSFHHLMLNSVDPDAAIAFYTKAFPDTKRTEWGGYPAISSPTHVLVLFNKVAAPPVADPLVTAYWHFGWNPPDQRAKVEALQAQGYQIRAALDRHRRRLGGRQQRHLSRRGRRLWLGRNQRADGGEHGQRRQAHGRPRLCLSDGTRQRADRRGGDQQPGTLQPCAHVAGRTLLRPALVPETSECDGARAAPRRAGLYRSQLPCAARRASPGRR